ncbi:hypothetical protein Tco_1301416 [Tanacetum coccineum]
MCRKSSQSLCLVQDPIRRELRGPTLTAPTSAVRNMAGRGKEYHKKTWMDLQKVQQEKLKAVKARLNFEEVSQHSESGTPSQRKELRKRLGYKHVRSISGSPEPRRDRSESPRKKVVAWILRVVTRVPAREEQNLLLRKIMARENPYARRKHCPKVEVQCYHVGHWEVKIETRKTQLSVKRTICLTGESFLRELPLAEEVHQRSGRNSPHQAKRWGIHKRVCAEVQARMQGCDGSSRMYENLRIYAAITTPKLIITSCKDKIPKLVDEMMRVTITFLRGEVATSNHEWKKSFPLWKQQEVGQLQNFKKGSFRNQQRAEVKC